MDRVGGRVIDFFDLGYIFERKDASGTGGEGEENFGFWILDFGF